MGNLDIKFMHPPDRACPGLCCVAVRGRKNMCAVWCVDDGSFALGKANLILDQTVGEGPEETFHLLDLWRLPGRP